MPIFRRSHSCSSKLEQLNVFISFILSGVPLKLFGRTRVFVSKDWHAPDTCCDRCAEAAGASLKGLEMLRAQTRRLGRFVRLRLGLWQHFKRA